jgi:hypothetical protein
MFPIALAQPTVTVAIELPERCDRCGAAGKVRTFLPGGGDLTFCGHHANRFSQTIRSSAGHVVVETGFGWRAAA